MRTHIGFDPDFIIFRKPKTFQRRRFKIGLSDHFFKDRAVRTSGGWPDNQSMRREQSFRGYRLDFIKA